MKHVTLERDLEIERDVSLRDSEKEIYELARILER
jgi:hypothetical protein